MGSEREQGSVAGSMTGTTTGGRTLGPITLEPLMKWRIWGVDTLPGWFSKPTDGQPIGEAWLTAESCAAEGTDLVSTLGELTAQYPAAFGNVDGNGFPLLLKLLFPREKLSVQVHPNNTEAQALGWPRGKTECWYVLDAEPGAEVAVGLRAPLSPEAMRKAIETGTLEDKLRYLPVSAGDMVYVDAGTVHAIGPGMTVLETQQYSDITYRLYDYGRPRELHVDAGLAVSRAETEAGLVVPQAMDGYTRLATSPYFVVDRFDLAAGEPLAFGKTGALQLLIALNDGAVLQGEGLPTSAPGIVLTPGHATVLPAEPIAYRLEATGAAQVVRIAQA